ncbi:MFS transporter [Actinoplanes sp. NPDC020271]|uniref:MFS transporter n=1 Tax=Actinoplanes sp. NPDC020271 TaxID=3363896 RepID=UPI003799BAEE
MPHTVPPAAWRMLALSVAAQAAGAMLVSTPAYLIPLLHLHRGLTLAEAGLFAAAPNFGTVFTLVLWGALADRYGERWVIAGGLTLTAGFALLAAVATGYPLLGAALLLGGAASVSSNAASGRVVAGWFPRSRRGLAMGIRQMAQPLGVAIAAVIVPPLAGHFGIPAPFVVAAVLTALLAAACAVGITDPPRPPATAEPAPNPYRGNGFLARIHVISALLVVPQFTLATFGLVWLITGPGWAPGVAGAVVAASQAVGALGRIAVGHLSDKVGSRVRVLRWVAVSGVVVMLALAAADALHWPVASGIVLIAAATVSVADNGLAFTSVAEAAGPGWSGKALGVQNTGQFLVAAAVGPGIGALVAAVGYPITFGLVALTPLASIPLVPPADQHAG